MHSMCSESYYTGVMVSLTTEIHDRLQTLNCDLVLCAGEEAPAVNLRFNGHKVLALLPLSTCTLLKNL